MLVGTDRAFTGAAMPSAAVTAGAAELVGMAGTAEATIIWEAITTEVAGTLEEAVADAHLGCIVALPAVRAWLHREAGAVAVRWGEVVAAVTAEGMVVEVTAAIISRHSI